MITVTNMMKSRDGKAKAVAVSNEIPLPLLVLLSPLSLD